jgi:hypothetical protein
MLMAIMATLTPLLSWPTVQHLARLFAKRHPELEPTSEKTRRRFSLWMPQ